MLHALIELTESKSPRPPSQGRSSSTNSCLPASPDGVVKPQPLAAAGSMVPAKCILKMISAVQALGVKLHHRVSER
jgi:hypothetical protein